MDENVDVEFATLLPNHIDSHVSQLGWKSITNGKLLQLAQDNGFQAFVTADKNMPYQQNMVGRPFSLFVLDIHPNNFENLSQCADKLVAALLLSESGNVYVIDGPHPKRK